MKPLHQTNMECHNEQKEKAEQEKAGLFKMHETSIYVTTDGNYVTIVLCGTYLKYYQR